MIIVVWWLCLLVLLDPEIDMNLHLTEGSLFIIYWWFQETFECKGVIQTSTLVIFLHLPAYIKNEET